MGYRVDYSGFGFAETGGRINRRRTYILAILFAAAFLALVYRTIPEGKVILDKLLTFQGWAVNRQALECMAGNLQDGMPFAEAITVFCREILLAGMEYADLISY